MEFSEVKDWLDAHVDIIEQEKQLMHLNSSVRSLHPMELIFLDTGIEIIADIMGLELECTVNEDRNYPYRYAIVYRNIEFVQGELKPLEGVCNGTN